ncbi:hypothetical protein GDO81_025467 [Engystomops pustulosus]|uniref:Uncharacterized protein n=1 Tax=Engystomops pustulosus TaxID=76066 RepID=A0AAV6YIG4_ENGPU|nr:hypothetical protein GDO81_025467 [Engystomops pustulosus]
MTAKDGERAGLGGPILCALSTGKFSSMPNNLGNVSENTLFSASPVMVSGKPTKRRSSNFSDIFLLSAASSFTLAITPAVSSSIEEIRCSASSILFALAFISFCKVLRDSAMVDDIASCSVGSILRTTSLASFL